MGRIILIHGAWGAGKTWNVLAPYLRRWGHHVTCLDLPGQGRKQGHDNARLGQVGLHDYAHKVKAELRDGPPAVLVGHSFGGMTISAVAEAMPEQVRRLIYVAAFLPQDGQSLLDILKTHGPAPIGLLRRTGPRPGSSTLPRAAAARLLFQDATQTQRILGQRGLYPQSDQPQIDPVSLSTGRFGRVPKEYVLCLKDRSVPPALQRAMLAAYPTTRVHPLDAGHVPQLTQAQRLAWLIHHATRRPTA